MEIFRVSNLDSIEREKSGCYDLVQKKVSYPF